jgi:hypothetical protein
MMVELLSGKGSQEALDQGMQTRDPLFIRRRCSPKLRSEDTSIDRTLRPKAAVFTTTNIRQYIATADTSPLEFTHRVLVSSSRMEMRL